MEEINLFEDNTELNSSHDYHLSIQIAQNGFTFSILDITEKKYIGLKHIDNQMTDNQTMFSFVQSIFEKESLLNKQYQSSSLLFCSLRSMLVPETLFSEKNLKSFLKFHHEIDENDHAQFTQLKKAEAFVIFAAPADVVNFIKLKHENIRIVHHSLPFITNALSYVEEQETGSRLFLNFGVDFFDVLIIKNSKIMLFNSFFYKKYSDVIYYLVNILNLFSLKPETVKLIVYGNIVKNAEIEEELAHLFLNMNFEKLNPDYSYSPGFSKIEPHKFVNLLNLYHCE